VLLKANLWLIIALDFFILRGKIMKEYIRISNDFDEVKWKKAMQELAMDLL